MNSSVTRPVRYVTAEMDDGTLYSKWTLFRSK